MKANKNNKRLPAAVMLLSAVCSWLCPGCSSKEEKLFGEYYKPDPGLISAMGVSDNYVFDKAMVDYKTGHYQTALQGWTALAGKGANNDTLQYYTGSAYLASEKTDSAIASFRKVMTTPGSIFFKDAYWYCGLALLKENKKDEAIPFIEQSANARKEELLARLKK